MPNCQNVPVSMLRWIGVERRLHRCQLRKFQALCLDRSVGPGGGRSSRPALVCVVPSLLRQAAVAAKADASAVPAQSEIEHVRASLAQKADSDQVPTAAAFRALEASVLFAKLDIAVPGVLSSQRSCAAPEPTTKLGVKLLFRVVMDEDTPAEGCVLYVAA